MEIRHFLSFSQELIIEIFLFFCMEVEGNNKHLRIMSYLGKILNGGLSGMQFKKNEIFDHFLEI